MRGVDHCMMVRWWVRRLASCGGIGCPVVPTRHVRTKDGPIINWTKVWWYGLFPALLSGAMLAMYFSGVPLLETIVAAPYFEAVHWNHRREFALLENLQHGILLAVVVIALIAVFTHRSRGVRVFMVVVALGAMFMFLEEIDYGLHYYEYLAGVSPDEIAERRNFHNVGSRTSKMKSIGTVATVLLFGVAPFLLARARDPWLRYFRPDPYMALLLLVAFATRSIAHSLDARGLGHGLEGNLSEFRELITYYTGLVYTIHLVRRCPIQLAAAAADREPAGSPARASRLPELATARERAD